MNGITVCQACVRKIAYGCCPIHYRCHIIFPILIFLHSCNAIMLAAAVLTLQACTTCQKEHSRSQRCQPLAIFCHTCGTSNNRRVQRVLIILVTSSLLSPKPPDQLQEPNEGQLHTISTDCSQVHSDLLLPIKAVLGKECVHMGCHPFFLLACFLHIYTHIFLTGGILGVI